MVQLPDAPHETAVWSLAANQDPANVRLLDLDTLLEVRDGGSARP
ncbi:MAG: hypothetical protein R2734_13445 [Nocardioides sp.]